MSRDDRGQVVARTYLTSETGKVVTQWPYGNWIYTVLTRVLGSVSETTRVARHSTDTRVGAP